MPLVAAVVCPHPPLLVPQMAACAAGELDDLRSACDEAIDSLWSAKPDQVIVIGSGARREYDPSEVGTFAPYGVPMSFSLGGPVSPVPATLPLSLTVAAWLLRSRPAVPPRRAYGVPTDMSTGGCADLGAALASGTSRLGLLIMGDGSACRGDKSPGYADPRAEAFDASVTKAFADVDTEALLTIDPVVAGELHVAGRAPWQVLAGAAAGVAVGVETADSWPARVLRGRVLYDAAPYGVNYTVAVWERA